MSTATPMVLLVGRGTGGRSGGLDAVGDTVTVLSDLVLLVVVGIGHELPPSSLDDGTAGCENTHIGWKPQSRRQD